MSKNPVTLLRHAGYFEAVSFLILLGVAMPLKYVWGHPEAVRIAGMVHGVFFLLLLGLLAWSHVAGRWYLPRTMLVFGAALVPGGPFMLERKLKRWAAEYAAGHPPAHLPQGSNASGR